VALAVGWVRTGYPPRRANSRAAGRRDDRFRFSLAQGAAVPTGGRQ